MDLTTVAKMTLVDINPQDGRRYPKGRRITREGGKKKKLNMTIYLIACIWCAMLE